MDHIEIDKENTSEWEYRSRKRNINPPVTPFRVPRIHGQTLSSELSSTVSTIIEARRNAGIDTDNLLVLELSGQANAKQPDADMIQAKMNLTIIEEIKGDEGKAKLIVQFENSDAIEAFKQEMTLYINGSDVTTARLTANQRNDLFSCIDGIHKITPEDRTGKRLNEAIANDSLPDGLFYVDIDVWYDGDHFKRNEIQGKIRQVLGTTGSALTGDLFVLPNLMLGRAKVNTFTLQALRSLDIIAKVDLPIGAIDKEHCELYSADFIPTISESLDGNAPLACVIDSGVFSGNQLLSRIVVDEEDFDLTEETTSDINGHGTGVAGIVAYGSFHDFDKENRIFEPLVRICNGKVMHNNTWDAPDFDESKRPEEIIDKAIRHFKSTRNCRVFNLSIGLNERIYSGGRQEPLASLLDNLIRELDIVVVVSSGNMSDPHIPSFSNRVELMSKARDQLLGDEHRLVDPGTSALGITVGSITRYEEPEGPLLMPIQLSAGKKGYPSVFTRTGKGVAGAVKPEFVDYGGNFIMRQLHLEQMGWYPSPILNEPTLSNKTDRVFTGWWGTSFAAPHVTHIAARLQRALSSQMGREPTGNLIKAMLASSAQYIEKDWLNASTPPGFAGKNRQEQEWRLRLGGYGTVDASTLTTDRNHVTLIAEDALDLKKIHLYKIPVPDAFIGLKSSKRISIGFAYNPPTRLSRQAYLANSLWFEVFRRSDEELLRSFISKKTEGNEEMAKEVAKEFRRKHDAGFKPGADSLNDSTLQQRVWEAGKNGGSALDWEGKYIYVLVTGKSQFRHPDEAIAQDYALAITFSYEGQADIELRQKISDQVKIKQREQVRTRTQIQV